MHNANFCENDVQTFRLFADMRISLNLDDGVKVNYGKSGDLLEVVKAVTGGYGDE